MQNKKEGLSYTYGDFNGQNIIPQEALTYDIILRYANVKEEKASSLVEKVSAGLIILEEWHFTQMEII